MSLLLLLLLAAVPSGAQEAATPPPAAPTVIWSRAVVPGSLVSVELPGSVEVRHAERRTPVGKVISDTLVVEPAGGWMAATVTHAPTLALRMAGPSTVMKQARNSVLDDADGEQLSWLPVVRGGREGMRLTFSATGKDGQPREGISEIYTFDGLVITLTALLDPGAAGLAQRFHDSVSL